MVVIGLGWSTVYVCTLAARPGGRRVFLSYWHRHGTAVWRASLFSPRPRSARLGPRPSEGKERLMIGWVALNPFAFLTPSFALGLGRSMGLVE